MTGERRAEFLRTWGPDFDQEGGGRGGGGKGRVGQLNWCVETINYSKSTAKHAAWQSTAKHSAALCWASAAVRC